MAAPALTAQTFGFPSNPLNEQKYNHRLLAIEEALNQLLGKSELLNKITQSIGQSRQRYLALMAGTLESKPQAKDLQSELDKAVAAYLPHRKVREDMKAALVNANALLVDLTPPRMDPLTLATLGKLGCDVEKMGADFVKVFEAERQKLGDLIQKVETLFQGLVASLDAYKGTYEPLAQHQAGCTGIAAYLKAPLSKVTSGSTTPYFTAAVNAATQAEAKSQ